MANYVALLSSGMATELEFFRTFWSAQYLEILSFPLVEDCLFFFFFFFASKYGSFISIFFHMRKTVHVNDNALS